MKFWYYCLTAAVFLISASFSLPHHHPLFSVPGINRMGKVLGEVFGGAQEAVDILRDGLLREGVVRCRPFFPPFRDYYYGYDDRDDEADDDDAEDEEDNKRSKRDVSGPVGYNENTSSTFHKPDYVFREPKEPYFEKIFACQTNCLRADNLGGFVFDGICFCVCF